MAKAKYRALSAEARAKFVARFRDEHGRWLAARARGEADGPRGAGRGRMFARRADALGADPAPAESQRPLVDIYRDTVGLARVMVKVVDRPWCDYVAAGLKFVECVTNAEQQAHCQLKQLQAGDLLVVLRKGSHSKVTAVGVVGGPLLPRQTDRGALLEHIPAERRDASGWAAPRTGQENFFARFYFVIACSRPRYKANAARGFRAACEALRRRRNH